MIATLETLRNGQYITLPRRGVRISAPPQLCEVLASIQARRQRHEPLTAEQRQSLWTPDQKARLNLLLRCKILARRFPTREDGNAFMQNVDPLRREEYLGYVEDMTANIVDAWGRVNPNKDIAVVLFGSVARGLVKDAGHPDPSNIDMTIIGAFTKEEKERLFDTIRPKREEIAAKIRASSPNLDYSLNPLPGNVGVYVQNRETLAKDGFGEARVYLASGAFALHDPAGIWKDIDAGAVGHEQALAERRLAHCRKDSLALNATIFSVT